MRGSIFADGRLIVREGDGDRALSTSNALPRDAHGYVLCAEETFDPPTTPLDADGQGIPYAVYGLARIWPRSRSIWSSAP